VQLNFGGINNKNLNAAPPALLLVQLRLADVLKTGGNRHAVGALFAEDAQLTFHSELPFGGVFRGRNQIRTHFARFAQTMRLRHATITKTFVNKQRFVVGVKNALEGQMLRMPYNTFNTTIDCVIEMDADGMATSMTNVLPHEEQLIKTAYATNAEKWFRAYTWQFFQSGELNDTSPLWDSVADSAVFEWNIPSEFLPQRIEGKADMKKFARQAHALMRKAPLKKLLKKMPHALLTKHVKVLHSEDALNESRLWAQVSCAGHGGEHVILFFAHTYNATDGKLLKETITFAKAPTPWLLLKKPSFKKHHDSHDSNNKGD
jgi:hypothetical protein